MVEILTAITIIDKILLLLDAGSAIWMKLNSILDDLKARHAAGQKFTSLDAFDEVAKMKEIDQDWLDLLKQRRLAEGISA